MSYCREHNWRSNDHECDCPYCEREREKLDAEAALLASVINDRAGTSFSTLMGGTGQTAHDYELTGEQQADFLLRFTVRLRDDAKRDLADDLIHLAVGLLSGGLAGTAEAVASKMVAKASKYFEELNAEEAAKAKGAA